MTSTIAGDAIKIYIEKYPNLKLTYNGKIYILYL